MNKYMLTFVAVSLTINPWIFAHGFWQTSAYQLAYAKVLETKPNACRVPDPKTCNCRKFTLEQPCLIQKWIFHPLFRTCNPYCMESHRTPLELMDLPSTRRECENLCGDPCLVTYPNGTTPSERGVCMGTTFCDIDPDFSWWQLFLKLKEYPCESESTRCCPRDYIRSNGVPYLLRP